MLRAGKLLGPALNFLLLACLAPATHAADGEAEWIWSPAQTRNEVPVGECYFRKTFDASPAEEAVIHITADNKYALAVNGQPVGEGVDWRQMQLFDVTKYLRSGRNVVAVRVTNTEAGAAGLAVRVLVKQQGGTYQAYSTDKTWKTSLRQFQSGTDPQFNDRDWVAAESYGNLGFALPWGNEVLTEGDGARFVIDSQFAVERLMRDEEVGSLIAMTFDSRGNIIASQEGGHLMLLSDSDGNGIHDRVTNYCEQVKNAQGLLALGSRVFAVGDGPEGSALYRLRDADRDGVADEVTKLIGFRGSKGEHGAHAVRLGPDGYIYVIVGDFARADGTPTVRSPYHRWYEGDLVQPRFEDAGGHEVGIPAPGGTIFRTNADGTFVELVAGGLRNSYDFAFDPQGELFTYDADMEWDRGAPWYRPTRVNHVTAGAEMGWRSGWAKWPEYYLDSLPAAVNIGPGSPTGVEFYDHFAFPAKYRGAMFGCDWATGRIYAVTFERQGATLVGKPEVFLAGRPLNATDIAVGPDGALYFSTGGRGTDGGIYRIRYTGAIPPELADMGRGVERALRQPQIEADWARARIATVKQQLGDEWGPQLLQVARNPQRSDVARQRAIDLLIVFGPRPDDALLAELAADARPTIRAKAARLMYQSETPAMTAALVNLLADDDALVRRLACESLARRADLPPADSVLPLLNDPDRFVAYAARLLMEQMPVESWAAAVLDESRPRGFCYGATALVNVERNAETSHTVLERCQKFLGNDALSDAERRDVLRVTQLALLHGGLGPDSAPSLAAQLLAMYPTADQLANRELVRLLVHLQVDGAADKFAVEIVKEALSQHDKIHLGAYAARLTRGWTTPAKLKLLQHYEEARAFSGGYSVDKYIENFARDFLTQLTLSERRHILAGGEKWPATALSVLAKLPEHPGAEVLATIRELDARVAPRCAESDAYRRLRVGIIAVLGGSDDADSQQHLRSIYLNEPEYRDPVAMCLAQHPGGENWAYLVDALKTARGPMAVEVLSALTKVQQRPSEALPYRNVIISGLRLGSDGGEHAAGLLAHWNGQTANVAANNWKSELVRWQSWYAEKFPDAPPAELPADEGGDKWSYDELVTFLESVAGKQGDAEQGRQVFAAAQCAACHRVGTAGETLGPDLTSVSQRFQRKEILESIVYPSHTISDQYASRKVIAGGKTYVGLASPRGNAGVTMLLPTGQKVELAQADIEEMEPSNMSAMPAGLLNSLTLEQVADLFAYLEAAPGASLAVREEEGTQK